MNNWHLCSEQQAAQRHELLSCLQDWSHKYANSQLKTIKSSRHEDRIFRETENLYI